jgi:3-deoxy-D-manno-octulosonic-acid transferase
MLAVYNTLLLPLRPLAELWAVRPGRDERGRREWHERLARRPLLALPGAVWLHGASVGEARLATALARELRAACPGISLVASTLTASGRSLLPSPPVLDDAFFMPLDFPDVVRRTLERLRPAALVLIETELWPNLLRESSRAAVPIALVNARLGPRRMEHYRRWSRLYAPLVARIDRIGAQSAPDAARFVELGAPTERVVVTGNVKYDLSAPTITPEELRSRLALDARRPVFVAGSTAPGEDAPVLRAFVQARRVRPDLLSILAPRHTARVDEAFALARSLGLSVVRLSSRGPATGADVVLVDTLGELAALYQLATVAFVGGSLVPVGGHNVLEPAAVGVPVLFGRHMHHFEEPARTLEEAGGAWRVADESELAARLVELVGDAERRDRAATNAARVVAENRGALAASVRIVLELLAAAPAAAGPAQ